MHVIKHFFAAFMDVTVSIVWAKSLNSIYFSDLFMMIINGEISGFKTWASASVYLFMSLFCIIGTIFFFCLGLYNLFMIFYCVFITDNRIIHVAVDENDIIQDTFLELSNGKIIPIKITKLKMDKLKEEVTGEQK